MYGASCFTFHSLLQHESQLLINFKLWIPAFNSVNLLRQPLFFNIGNFFKKYNALIMYISALWFFFIVIQVLIFAMIWEKFVGFGLVRGHVKKKTFGVFMACWLFSWSFSSLFGLLFIQFFVCKLTFFPNSDERWVHAHRAQQLICYVQRAFRLLACECGRMFVCSPNNALKKQRPTFLSSSAQ